MYNILEHIDIIGLWLLSSFTHSFCLVIQGANEFRHDLSSGENLGQGMM